MTLPSSGFLRETDSVRSCFLILEFAPGVVLDDETLSSLYALRHGYQRQSNPVR